MCFVHTCCLRKQKKHQNIITMTSVNIVRRRNPCVHIVNEGLELFINGQWALAENKFDQALSNMNLLQRHGSYSGIQDDIMKCHLYLEMINIMQNIPGLIQQCQSVYLRHQLTGLSKMNRFLSTPHTPIFKLMNRKTDIVAILMDIIRQRNNGDRYKGRVNSMAWECLKEVSRWRRNSYKRSGYSKLEKHGILEIILQNMRLTNRINTRTSIDRSHLAIIENAAFCKKMRYELLQNDCVNAILQFQSQLIAQPRLGARDIKTLACVTKTIIKLCEDRPTSMQTQHWNFLFANIAKWIVKHRYCKQPSNICFLLANMTHNVQSVVPFNLIEQYNILQSLSVYTDIASYVDICHNMSNHWHLCNDSNTINRQIQQLCQNKLIYNLSMTFAKLMKHGHYNCLSERKMSHLILNMIQYGTLDHLQQLVDNQVFDTLLTLQWYYTHNDEQFVRSNHVTTQYMTQQESLSLIRGYWQSKVIKDISRIILNYYCDYSAFYELSVHNIILHIIGIASIKSTKITIASKFLLVNFLRHSLINVDNSDLKRFIIDIIRDITRLEGAINDDTRAAIIKQVCVCCVAFGLIKLQKIVMVVNVYITIKYK